jgi:predicted Zn-dependent protease with MMP-like domain
LFAANLLAAFPPEEIDEQVTVTVLHEIGHFFGLDEDEVAALGLA